MKACKFLIVLAITTFLTLGYVHQKIELLKVGYSIEESGEDLVKLLDRNSFLLYNVIALKSPQNLERLLLAKNMTFQLPAVDQFIQINQPQFEHKLNGWERTKVVVANIFTLNSNAEARTVNKNK